MAADVDKATPENGSKISAQTGHQSPGSGSWISKGLWTLLLVGAVPLLAFGLKYYQDAQLLKRHVRSVITLRASHNIAVFLICLCFNLENNLRKYVRGVKQKQMYYKMHVCMNRKFALRHVFWHVSSK